MSCPVVATHSLPPVGTASYWPLAGAELPQRRQTMNFHFNLDIYLLAGEAHVCLAPQLMDNNLPTRATKDDSVVVFGFEGEWKL